MSPETNTTPTLEQALPWIPMVLDMTERLTALIPEEKLSWRLPDPSGRWAFSLGELALHCADSRRMFARQLAGDASETGYWSDGPGEGGVWKFRDTPGREEILRSLRETRAELQLFLDRPAADMTAITDGARATFARALEQMKSKGQDSSAAERRGPPNIVRILMAVVAHENGHRAVLQTMLRLQGINPPE